MIIYIKKFFAVYFSWVLVFMMQKPLFMLCHFGLYKSCNAIDWFGVILHGLPLDLALAAYLTALPALILIATVWTSSRALHIIVRIYFGIAATIVATAFVVNIALYGFWGIPLDTTPLFYFLSSPTNALASVSLWFVLGGAVAIIVCTFLIYRILLMAWKIGGKGTPKRVLCTALITILTASLFIPIRGGFTTSTTNTGKVYYSEHMPLNHAAVNPLFSFMEAFAHEEDFTAQYRFMDDKRATELFNEMIEHKPDTLNDSLFTTRRPNIVFVVLESFSVKLMQTRENGVKVTHCIDSLAHEGIYFDNFYANSFRTDRGLVAILSGYPAQPTMSIMKYPHKTEHIPSICSILKQKGYRSKYYYGGDADFCNMRSYLVSSGFGSIVSETDFPISTRRSKWGAPDHVVFDRVLNDFKRCKSKVPTFTVVQTLSSHEPFDVPCNRFRTQSLNAFAYTDSCLGRFVDTFRTLPQWKNTLIVIVPDHLGAYPEKLSYYQLSRYHIPLIFTGGAIRRTRTVHTIGSQQDIAATLLGQLGIDHRKMIFSKNMLNPHAPHFAFFAVPDAFGMVTEDNQLIYDNSSTKVKLNTGKCPGQNLERSKAYLQKLYDDIDKR